MRSTIFRSVVCKRVKLCTSEAHVECSIMRTRSEHGKEVERVDHVVILPYQNERAARKMARVTAFVNGSDLLMMPGVCAKRASPSDSHMRMRNTRRARCSERCSRLTDSTTAVASGVAG